ncbi:hypothetical protein [Neobacillus cucumis]
MFSTESKFKSDVKLEYKEKQVNLKSLIGRYVP